MYVKIEPSGTQIVNGKLVVRLDVFPEVGDKTYTTYYIQVPDPTSSLFKTGYMGKVDADGNPLDQADYDLWYASLPKIWQLNPCLCHFITLDSTTTLAQLRTKIQVMFGGTTSASVDDILSKPDSPVPIGNLMRTKISTASVITGNPNLNTLKNTINTRFASLQVKL